MGKTIVPPLAEYFREAGDPQIERKKLCPLIEVIVITLLAFMSGAEEREGIGDYARAKEQRLRKFMPLKNGLPEHDVYRRVFARLIPGQIERCFMERTRDIRLPIKREVIAIDGKTMRGSADDFKALKAARIVSACATEQRITLAQVKTDVKSNEITEIPELLTLFALKGCIVTIDAAFAPEKHQVHWPDKSNPTGGKHRNHREAVLCVLVAGRPEITGLCGAYTLGH